jgi:hypothetical protein
MKNSMYVLSLIFLFSTFSLATNAQTQLGESLTGENVWDTFGRMISLSDDGNRVAIGVPRDDNAGEDAGKVQIYEWANSAWSPLGSAIYGEVEGDFSGWILSLSGDGKRVVIGSPENDGNGSGGNGQVRVFEWSNDSWVQVGEALYSEEGTTYDFGDALSLSLNGNRLAVGNPSSGIVQIFEWNNGTWEQMGEDIEGEYVSEEAGWAVSLSDDGNRVAIGARENSNNGYESGCARIFEWNNGAWIKMGQDINGEAQEDNFGYAVSLSADGNRVAIGGIGNDANGSYAGHTKVFEWSNDNWVQMGQDIDGEAEKGEEGHSVSLSANGNRLVTGAPSHNDSGQARIFEWNNGSWEQIADIPAEDEIGICGSSVSLSADGSRAAISDPGFFFLTGMVRIFSLSPVSTYEPDSKLANPLIYPNPAQDKLFFSLEYLKAIQVVNAQGRVMLYEENPKSPIDLSHLPSGMYIVKMKGEKGEVSKKIIKE